LLVWLFPPGGFAVFHGLKTFGPVFFCLPAGLGRLASAGEWVHVFVLVGELLEVPFPCEIRLFYLFFMASIHDLESPGFEKARLFLTFFSYSSIDALGIFSPVILDVFLSLGPFLLSLVTGPRLRAVFSFQLGLKAQHSLLFL